MFFHQVARIIISISYEALTIREYSVRHFMWIASFSPHNHPSLKIMQRGLTEVNDFLKVTQKNKTDFKRLGSDLGAQGLSLHPSGLATKP